MYCTLVSTYAPGSYIIVKHGKEMFPAVVSFELDVMVHGNLYCLFLLC